MKFYMLFDTVKLKSIILDGRERMILWEETREN